MRRVGCQMGASLHHLLVNLGASLLPALPVANLVSCARAVGLPHCLTEVALGTQALTRQILLLHYLNPLTHVSLGPLTYSADNGVEEKLKISKLFR